MKLIQEIINDRDREIILNGELIEGSKVGEHSPIVVFI